MAQLPFVGFKQELIFRHVDAVALGKRPNDLLEFFFVRGSEVNRNAEPGHERKLLLNRIIRMKIAVQLLVVTEAFLDQMAPVRRRINQDIVRLLLQSTLNYRFQILVFDLKLLKGKIIHVNNKFIIAVLNLRDDLI